MLPKHYNTDSLQVYLSEMRRAEREMNTRIRDKRIKPTYRRRTRTALRGITRERRAIEQELAKRPDVGEELKERSSLGEEREP